MFRREEYVGAMSPILPTFCDGPKHVDIFRKAKLSLLSDSCIFQRPPPISTSPRQYSLNTMFEIFPQFQGIAGRFTDSNNQSLQYLIARYVLN